MEAKIAADAKLDYVMFQNLEENRYDACIHSDDKEEIIKHGPLDQLLERFPHMKDAIAKESYDGFKLELPDNVDQNSWFTKATLTRFLHIIGSSDSLNKSVAISKEMSQLEETRQFHLSLYAKKAENGFMPSEDSKNELLRAMDLRLAALTEELVSTFNTAAGTTFTYQEMNDLQDFCQHFGDEGIRNLLSKLSEMSQKNQTAPSVLKNDSINMKGGDVQLSGLSHSVKPVIYNASPAKAAEIERQNSTESEDSPFSSEDDEPPVERSRTLIRSATPRRSASPMRRVQIGRSGPRRTPALTIKSLIPARERISFHRDAGSDSDLDEPKEPNKKTEVNVSRMSVQDAISLFESKKRDQENDSQKKSVVDSSTNANKCVLRRWSSGIEESQKHLTKNLSEITVSESYSNMAGEDASKSDNLKPDMNIASENSDSRVSVKVDMGSETCEETESHSNKDDVSATQAVNTGKMDSVEWSRQKEAELSQMLLKMAEYKNTEPNSVKKRSSGLKQRSMSHIPRIHNRDEKLVGEFAGRRTKSEIRAKQKIHEESKAGKSSSMVSDVRKKLPTNKSPTINKNPPPPTLSSKKETPKSAASKKPVPKPSTMPATRKSWPSTPSPRTTGTLPAKSPTGTLSGTTAPRGKSQPPAPSPKHQTPTLLSRQSPKLEKPQLQQKDVKKAQVETKKTTKRVDDSKTRVLPKSGKSIKTKTGMTPEEDTGTTPAKAVVRKKVTKKSSVVPVEGKPSTRKLSGSGAASKSTVQKVEIPTQVGEKLITSADPINIQENTSALISDTVHLVEDNPVLETSNVDLNTERDIETEKPKDCVEEDIPIDIHAQGGEVAEGVLESSAEVLPVQEPLISPAAWVESSEHDQSIPSGGNYESPSPLNHDVVASPVPRVRHSLSQMLLEESSEPDVIEWGNAENPPTMVYHKDAPKGIKRLLKFARKNKEVNGGGMWASPYTSEGEDDGDDTKSLGKRHSDNLLRKVALHSKNYGEGFLSDSEPLSARSNVSNSSARTSNKFQEGHASSKGTKSFFSLSAFRGNKN